MPTLPRSSKSPASEPYTPTRGILMSAKIHTRGSPCTRPGGTHLNSSRTVLGLPRNKSHTIKDQTHRRIPLRSRQVGRPPSRSPLHRYRSCRAKDCSTQFRSSNKNSPTSPVLRHYRNLKLYRRMTLRTFLTSSTWKVIGYEGIALV